MKVSTTSQRLKEIMNLMNLRQVDILEMTKPYCEKFNVKMNKSDISQYVSGLVEPGQEKLFILGRALNVNEAWLMGFDVPMNDSQPLTSTDIGHTTSRVPLLGTIAAGLPILAEENIEGYFNIDSSVKADFALKVKGESMIEAGILEEDIVFIRQQDFLLNGEIGAILIEDEATLKRFYQEDGTVILQSENKQYQPMIYTNGNIRVLGKLVAVLNIRE